MKSLYLTIITTLFPPSCFICHKEETPLCDNCLSLCKKAIDTPHTYITSVYSFRDPYIKKIIHSIKYFHKKDLIEPLIHSCYGSFAQLIEPNTVLVPIPMPRLRKYLRGYNQAELFAEAFSKLSQLPTKNTLLTRLKSPQRQVASSSRAMRLLNQKNSFSVKGSVQGLTIILIDDVATTGATLDEARKELLKHGAKEVRAFTIAH